MSEVIFQTRYRDCDIFYVGVTNKYFTECFPGMFDSLGEVKAEIDAYREGLREEPTETYVQTYLECDIYYYSPADNYGSPCTPLVRMTLTDLRRLIEEYRVVEPIIEPPPPVDEEPPPPVDEEPPPEEEIPIFETPSLPWYAAWLKPIIDYLGLLTESAINFFAPIFEPIKDLANFIGDLPGTLFKSLSDGIGDLVSKSRDRGTSIAVDTTSALLEGTPEWVKQLQANIEAMQTPILDEYLKAVNIETYEESMFTGEKAVQTLNLMRTGIMGGAIANFVVHAIIEAGSLGQFEFMRDLDPMVISKLGLDKLAERATMIPLEMSVLLPAEQEYASRHPNVIPPFSDLINMVVKEVIPIDEFKTWLGRQGYSEEWATRIWDAHFLPPNFQQILQAYYRGAITREQVDEYRVLVDLDPRYETIWNSLIEVIPPYGELVNQLVKEVITLDEFTKYLQWHGYDAEWAKRIWDAHFIPPSLGDILTAWRRGLIDEKRVDELMILVDLDPRFKEIFDTRKYADPSITMARYMFETGAIEEGGVRNIIQRAGFLPGDVDAMTSFIVKFQERRFQRRYLTALERGVVTGAYTEEELTEAVVDAGYTPEVALWMIKTADVRKRIAGAPGEIAKVRILTLTDLRKAYIRDIMSEDVFRMELGVRGYEIGDIDILVQLLTEEKHYAVEGKKVYALSVSQMLNAYRYEEWTRDELVIQLQTRGLSVDETETLIRTKEKQWGVSPP